MIDKVLEYRLAQIESRIEMEGIPRNTRPGNEISFWIFDYPAEKEIRVREFLRYLVKRLEKKRTFVHLNIFKILIDMLEARNLFERVCEREKQMGTEAMKKQLSGLLSQKKIAEHIANTTSLKDQELAIISGLGNAWPFVRGHELMSALQDVMGFTPLLMFYPGTYSGYDLTPLTGIDSRNYYRAFRLVPETGPTVLLNNP
ncbi:MULTISPECIES: DUF1788 domain-containing protein [Photorhabdus]|uniref:Cytoplasmic protein n=2 Tax=Photorhabdus asymbiotica TaxID=291112 RepID=B6VME0_PHOAA|nr:DUF1788 domain-containing protein [Photorhabdus asymbiotica]RKS58141.1 uncharacterized protein DUF1788 [Photorhabdus asymbiotica]CAQ82522.1 conserved hypothetical protein [Photorhabdus asymbiotica]CAR67320.1 Hypothetical Protein PA-RVA12-2468 [Photorhabdus asymbiotica subsp. asymbiotica ATCC 43949]